MKIAIIASQFNKKITGRLLDGAKKGLAEGNVPSGAYRVFKAPGAFEIPFMAQKLCDRKEFDGIIALGCVIEGETDHYRAVCDGVTYGLQKVSIENRMPVMFGVLMCRTIKQAFDRSGTDKNNKGYECVKGLLKIFAIT